MALPMINEAREAHPGSTLTVLVPDHLADLFEFNPAIDELIRLRAEHIHGLIAVFKIKELIKPYGFDVGYILPPSFGAASGFKLAGVKERIGYIADGRRLLLTKPLPLPMPLNSTHRSETYFNLLRRGAGVELEYVAPKLFLNENDIGRAAEILGRLGINENTPYAAIAFQAVAESRRWGTENYISLIKEIVTDRGLKVVLIGGAGDKAVGDEIMAATGPGEVINLAGKTALREAAAILSRARFFVGNDSGPAHLAASVGIPIVVLSGADDPAETSPVSNRKKLVYLSDLDCISCVKNVCPLKDDRRMQCMRRITVDMVSSAIDEVLALG